MQTIITFYNSSVGKKLIVGLTGLLLISYLVIHLMGNLLLFRDDGGEAFDAYAATLPQIVIIRIIEVLLFLIFILHIITSAYTWLLNKQAGKKAYEEWKKSQTSKLSSRTMFITGSIIFIFLVIHLQQFWYAAQVGHGENFSMYEVVKKTFTNPYYGLFYIIAMWLLGFHLKHGFQSAFQTLGLKNKKYGNIIEWAGVVFWLIIPLTFAVMPLYFLIKF